MLQSLIGKIDSFDSQSAEQLVELIERHPYCQAFQMLYAVALANIHSTKLNVQVQRAAISMPDRLKLCQVVSKGEYEWISLLNEIEARRNSDKNRAANDDFMLIERYLDNIGEPSSDSLPYDISSAALANNYEWDYADECETSNSDEQDALIDSFIEAEEKGELFVPKVQNVEENSPQAMDSLSLKKIREKAFLSESLAKLYVKQHKYEQALAIFSSLNLKYSKKFTYFAHQIRYLESILSYEKGEESK